MKVIKFRAWDKQEKKMVLNPLVTDIDDPANYIGLNDLPKKFADKGFELMQFTGLKDKNGKEIYEGDIVKCENGNFEVKWGHFTNNVNSDEYSEAHYGYYIGEDEQFEDFEQIWNANLFEVIGNIYENKETLKKNWRPYEPYRKEDRETFNK